MPIFDSLTNQINNCATNSIGNDDLVVGDVFKFEAGMKLPADGVVI